MPIAKLAFEKKQNALYIPEENKNEASVVPNINVFGIESLLQLIRIFNKTHEIEKTKHVPLQELITKSTATFDFREIIIYIGKEMY